MRYLLLSDLHSNVEALYTCLELAAGKYDEALCLGDLVGYGPNPNEVVDKVRNLCQVVIRGNHDKACCGIDDAKDRSYIMRVLKAIAEGEVRHSFSSVLPTLTPPSVSSPP